MSKPAERNHVAPGRSTQPVPAAARRRAWVVAWLSVVAAVALLVVALAGCGGTSAAPASQSEIAANPGVDPGSALSGPAPNFTLTDQFGRRVSLAQFRGRAVLLAFVDSQCTTICPLTTISLLHAVQLLGPAGRKVQLLGIDANPLATAVSDVRAYSMAHQMMHQWLFLTAPLARLKQVWKDYHVYVAASHGSIDHQPAIYLIDPSGRERAIFLTQMAYTSPGQQAQLLADAAAKVLPGHPAVRQQVSLRFITGVGPHATIGLPVAGGTASPATVTLGPGHPYLLVFFATWVSESTNLTAELLALNRYQAIARARGWPTVVAIDETLTETNPAALPALLHRIGGKLDYPVVEDRGGRLADGYRVQDQPWIDLASPAGRLLITHDGWLSLPELIHAASKPRTINKPEPSPR